MHNIQLEQFNIHCQNLQECQDIIKEIFLENEYYFQCPKKSPVIIDCGSHIGLSIVYFKKIYPQSLILAFEPNPSNFFLLKENIRINNFQNIEVVNAALSNIEGTAYLFGEFGKDNSRSCGNSLLSNWANSSTEKIKIKTLLLSSYINQSIDFLKIDIEGYEYKVLLEVQNKLSLISEICIEYHGIENSKDNNINNLLSLLEHHDFITEVKNKNLSDYFPSDLLPWATNSKFQLATIRAKRK